MQHRAAITDEAKLGGLMRGIDEYDGWPTIRAALLLLALTMTRPGDVRHMRRSEINFVKATWQIPAERMKMRRPHDVPLSRQALEVLREVWELSSSELVLPSIRSPKRPLSENAMNAAFWGVGPPSNKMVSPAFLFWGAQTPTGEASNPPGMGRGWGPREGGRGPPPHNKEKDWPGRI